MEVLQKIILFQIPQIIPHQNQNEIDWRLNLISHRPEAQPHDQIYKICNQNIPDSDICNSNVGYSNKKFIKRMKTN